MAPRLSKSEKLRQQMEALKQLLNEAEEQERAQRLDTIKKVLEKEGLLDIDLDTALLVEAIRGIAGKVSEKPASTRGRKPKRVAAEEPPEQNSEQNPD